MKILFTVTVEMTMRQADAWAAHAGYGPVDRGIVEHIGGHLHAAVTGTDLAAYADITVSDPR